MDPSPHDAGRGILVEVGHMKKLTLYGRPACHLCQDMELELQRLAAEFEFELEVVDIDGDPALLDRHGEQIPVLMGEGGEICHYFLDEVALRRYLQPE